MITPEFLKPGDKVAIVAPARKVTVEEMQPGIDKIQSWGFEVIKGMNLFGEDNQFSGTDQQRWADLQMMLDDESVKAILFARGGYGVVRIIDKLNFTKFMRTPKWLVGFSDITVLHSHVSHHCKVETLHAPMVINFTESPPQILERIRQIITGNHEHYEAPPNLFNRLGNASAELTGGNLSIIHTLAGTGSDLHTKGKILFLEDIDEYLYHIDRMMINLKRTGKLASLKGLIVGGMTDMKDNTIPFGKSAEEIILDAVKEYNYPVCFGFSAGHLPENNPLIIGRKVKMAVGEKVILSF